MKPAAPLRGALRHCQRGAAAIELALVISATFVLLPALALFAQVFYQYSVIKGATQNVATYLSTLPSTAVKDDTERARAFALAQRMLDDAAAGAGLSADTKVEPILILCNGFDCTGLQPKVFIVKISVTIDDMLFNAFTHPWTDGESKTWVVNAESTIPFVK